MSMLTERTATTVNTWCNIHRAVWQIRHVHYNATYSTTTLPDPQTLRYGVSDGPRLIPCPGEMCPTVIDKSQPIESIGPRLRDYTRTFDSGVRARTTLSKNTTRTRDSEWWVANAGRNDLTSASLHWPTLLFLPLISETQCQAIKEVYWEV